MIPSIPIPDIPADTFPGQVQWFMYGFGYASALLTVALMIKIFRKTGGGGSNFEN